MSMMTSVYCSYTADVDKVVEKGVEKGPYTSVGLMQTRQKCASVLRRCDK